MLFPSVPVAVPGEENVSKVIVDLSKGGKDDDLEQTPGGDDQQDNEEHEAVKVGEVCQVLCPCVYVHFGGLSVL